MIPIFALFVNLSLILLIFFLFLLFVLFRFAQQSNSKGGAMNKGKSKKRVNAFANSTAAKRQMQNK